MSLRESNQVVEPSSAAASVHINGKLDLEVKIGFESDILLWDVGTQGCVLPTAPNVILRTQFLSHIPKSNKRLQ